MRKLCFPLFFLLFFFSIGIQAKNTTENYSFENHGFAVSASINGTTSVCQGSGPQQITFTGSGGTAPYTFVYKINNGANHTVTTTSGNSVTVNASSNTAGTFEYTLVSVDDSAPDSEPQTVSGSATVTVNALPTITGDDKLCVGSTLSLDGSGQQAPNPAWSSSNTAVATVNNSGTVTGLAPGTTTITYTSSNGCQETKVITVNGRPTVNFTFDNNNSCSGTNVGFTPSVTGGQGPYSYSWNFGDGDVSSATSPTHKFVSIGCGTENFQVVLTVTDANGCTDNVTRNVTVKQKPHAGLEDQNIFSPFSNCENNPSLENPEFTITVNNVSTDPECTTSYTLNWGDGNTQTNLTPASFPLTHTYTQLGVFNLTFTAIGSNGCNNTVVYPVANQSNPAGSLGTLGSTTGLCAPATVPFTIGNWELNSPGTTYILNFGDGSSQTLQHPLTSSTVYHTYESSSCPNPSYTATLMVVNLCDETPYTAGNIQVRIKPYVSFTGPETACSTQEVCFVNETVVGSTGSTCNNLTAYQWNFGDPASPTNTVNVNTAGTPQGCHTFSGPGIYTVTLSATNPCGTHSYSQQICIEAPLSTPSFTLNDTTGCAPFAVSATNTSNVTGACDPEYQWIVSYSSATNCGTAPASNYNYFTNGTTAASENPSFNFPNAGTYTVRLRVTNSCGTVTTTQNVVVTQPPTVNINPIADLCGADQVTFTPQLTMTNCGSDPVTYLWSFPGATPSTSTDAQPSVIYTSPGEHTFSVEVTNECGSTTDTETFSISPTVIVDAGDDVTICNGTSTQLNGQASGGVPGYTYQWSPSTGLSSTSIANPVATPTTTTTYTLTVRDTQNCPKTSEVTVAVNTLNQGSIGNGQTICSGGDPVAFTSGAASGTGTLTYQWEMSTTGATGTYTDIPGATDAIYDSPPLTVNTWFRRKVISTLNGLECIKTTNFVEVIINDVEPGEVSADQQICSGGTPAAFSQVVAATGTGTLTYQWQSSADNTNWNDISSSPNTTYSSGPLTQTTYFRRRVTSSQNSVFCTEYSNVITVTVVPDPVVDVQPVASQTICLGAPVTALTVDVSGGIGTYTYQWYSNTANSNTGGTPVSGQVNDNFTPVPLAPGTYYYYAEIIATGPGCSVKSDVAQVIVMPAPTITTHPASSSVCVGGVPTLLTVGYTNGIGTPTYEWFSNTTNSTVGGIAIPSATTSSYQPDAATVGTTYYYAVLTFASGGCNAITSSVAAVEVNPAPAITTQPEPAQDICVGGSSAALSVAYTGGSGTASYQWYSNVMAANSGGTLIPSATSATYTPPVFATAGNYYYYAVVTLSAGGCDPVASQVAQVTVVADPVVDTQPLADQTACQNGAPLDLEVAASGGVGALSYQWYSNATNSSTGGTLLPGQTAAAYEPSTATLGTAYYYVVITAEGSGCSVTSAVAKVVTVQAPFVTTQPASGTVCLDGTPGQLNVAYANGTGTASYQWFSNATNSNSGGIAIPSATSAAYQPVADAVGTTYYYAEITFSSGGCSLITSNTATVEVVPMPTITTQPTALQEICAGGSVPAFTVASQGGTGAVTYQWYSNNTASNTGGTIINGATASTYTPPAFATTGTYYYYAVITISGSGCGTLSSEVAQVNVVPDPVVNTQPLADQTACQNGTPLDLVVSVSGGVGVLSYQWYSNTANNNTTGTAIANADEATYEPLTNTLGTVYYYVKVTAEGSGCSVTSAVAKVVTVQAPFVTTQPASGTVCLDGTPGQLNVAYANGTGTASYQWFSNATNSNSGGIAIPSATSAAYQPVADAVGTTYYYAEITFSSGGCSLITSNTAAVEVVPMPTITTQPTALQEICAGGSVPAFTVASQGGTGAVTYQWYSNNTASNTGGTPINGATASTYTPPAFATTGTYYYYAVITISGSGCGTLSSEVAQVNVVPDPVVDAQPLATQTLCQGSTPDALTVTVSGGSGTPQYQWYSNTANNTTGGTMLTGQTNASYIPSTATVGTVYYYVVVTTPVSGCSVTSSTAAVVVIESPVFTTQPQDETLCHGEVPAMLTVAYANGTGTASYQWYSNTADSADTATADLIPGAVSATYQPSGTDAGTLYYFATVSFSSGGCLIITSETAQITINALPQITSPQTVEVCNNEAINFAPANGGGNTIPAGTQYTWTLATGSGFTGATAQSVPQNEFGQTLTNTTNAAVTATYTVTPISNGCNGDAFTLAVTVKPEPQIQDITQAICGGGSFNIDPATITGAIVPADVTYTWGAPAVTGGMTGGAAGTGETAIGGSLVNPTNTAQTATYTVSIVSPAGVCEGDPFTITVTVNPTPHVGASIEETICSSGTFTVMPVDGSGNIIPANTAYTWNAPVINPAGAITGGSAQAAPQIAIAQALVNTTSDSATATYTVTPISGSCAGETFEVVVTVNPVPTVDNITSQTLCGGSATTAVAFTGATAGTVYNWTNTTASIGLATSGQGDIPSFIATNGGTAPVTATITVTPVFEGCPGTPKTFTITVNPAPTVSFSQAAQSICSGTASTAVTLTSATAGAAITWTAVQPAGITGVITGGTSTIPAQTLTNTTSSPITVTYTAMAATADASACPGPAATYTIVVNPVPFVGAPIAEAICSGDTATITPPDGAPNNIPAGTTFTWTAPTGTGFTGGTAQPAPQPSFSQTLVNTTALPVTATYTVTPSANGCTGVPFEVAITVNPKAIIGNATQTICTGNSFSVNPADNATLLPANTLYSWNAPTVTGGITGGMAGSGQTLVTGTLVNPSGVMQTATYTVIPVSPDGNCAGAPFTVIITVSTSFTVSSVVSDYNGFEISVAGGTDGSIDLTPTGGSGTYTYAWNGPGGFAAATQDITSLTQGNYTVTISDGLCADVVLQFQLVEPLPLVIAQVIPGHVNVNCFGEGTGVIEVAITEVSVGPFDYAILLANGTLVEDELNTMAENHVFDNLPAGTYNIRVTDANGTIKFINGIVITQPAAALAISNSVVSNFNGFNISCNGANNAGIDITMTGGTPGYSYAWTGPNGFAATTQDIASLAPGNYTVIITDSTGVCTVTQTYTITEPLPLALSSVVSDFNGFEIACFGGTSGSINVTPSGGTGTYNYQWAGPNGFVATTQDVANLAVGTYTLTMTDSNNCALAVQTYTLDQPAAITATETHVNVLCFGASTGSIDVTVAGGVISVSGGYSFAWTGPNSFLATTEDLNNIAAGTYHLTITDDSGCTRTLVVVVTQQPEIIITPTTTPISCYGANDASITLNITGGDAPYVAEWSNLAVGTFQDNLAAGNYVITVTDDSGCQKQITVVINEAPIFTINPVVTQITCHGADDGSIALNLVGGQAPVTMTWNDGDTSGTTRNNLGPGTYTATIFDGTPCQIVRTFTIVEPLALNIGANVTHATVCDNAQSGAINLHPGGGVPPYTFAWSNGATTEDLTGLTSGTYIVTVTDVNGCSKTMQYAVTRPDALSLTVNQNVQFNCDAHTVTQTNIAQASGGLPPFTYTWSAGTVSGGNGQMMTTNVNGTYIATVTDAMGCSVNFTFEVDTQQLGEADFYVESYAHTTFGVYSIFDPIQFTNTSTGDYTGVSWNFGDGSVSDEENPGHTYVREGVYTVLQTVTYPYGCVDKRLIIINVGKGYDVMIPNAFTPNADGTNDTFAAVFKGLKSIELAVYDTWGSMIYYEKGDVIQGWNGMINGVPAENGNYVYRITAETFYGQLVNYEGPFALIK